MKVGCLISGGKDSWYATHLASKKNDIKCLIAIKSMRKDSYMFHVPAIELVNKQSECCEIPLIEMPSSGIKEEELKELKEAVELAKLRYKIKGLVCGAIKSNYQKERVANICKDLDLELIAPLWGKDEDFYMRELLLNKFEVIITGISAEGFDKKWLGRELNARALEELKELKKKYGVSICGEGGEFESLVLDCPLFKKRIKLVDSKKIMEEEYSGYLKINKVELIEKS